jgi:DNA-binding transcriptional LysR family regulator
MRDIRRIDLNLLVALDALLEEQSVTKAADRLALTQPTVSAMLARLRKLLGDPLFVRTRRGIVPTPRAAALAPKLKHWLLEAQALVVEAAFVPSAAEFSASLCANDYIQSALIVPFFARLHREAPNVRLAVRNPQFADLPAMLADGELDLCLTTTPEIPSLDLHSRTLYEERYVGVARRGHPLTTRKRITLEQFSRYPHVMVSPTEGRFVGPTDRALAAVGQKRRVALSAPGFLILPEVLKTGDFVAIVPERVLAGRMAGLAMFAPPIRVPGFAVVMLWHARVHHDAAHRWLRTLLAETARDIEPLDKRTQDS